MAKYEVLIKAVVLQGLSYGEVARRHGVSKTLVHKLHHRWLAEGDAAYEPRSRRPRSSPNRTPAAVRERVLAVRDQLVVDGLDAGADTISEHLARDSIWVSRVTVWRILTAAGRVTPQPQKRPRSSWHRFVADRPNELWQSDFTHVLLSTGVEVEIIGWLDDHSRYLLHLTCHRRVTGRIVTDTFTTTAQEHGYPAATLTDNGMVYTTRYARNAPRHRRRERVRDPARAARHHPEERETVQTHHPRQDRAVLANPEEAPRHPPAATLTDLQTTLDAFRDYYNTVRPHRGIGPENPRVRVPADPESHPHPTRRPRTLAGPLRHHRPRREDQPPPPRPDAAPRHRPSPRPRRDHLPHPQQRRHRHHRRRQSPRRIHPEPHPRLPTKKRLDITWRAGRWDLNPRTRSSGAISLVGFR